MNREELHDRPTELGIASVATQGSFGPVPEKESTMHLGISDE